MEKHTVSRLVGSPPGYVGHDEGGQLTEIIRRKPYAVILFDEIEKAHPDVFNILLQILDDGRLTDGKGRVVNFKHSIIIMTSNLGNQVLQEYAIGFAEQSKNKMDARKAREAEVNTRIMKILRDNFKLEFLNRIDEIVLFHPLREEDMIQIVDLQLAEVQKRLNEKRIVLEVPIVVKKFLAEKGYDPTFGARPLKRVIQAHILDPLALEIVERHIVPGQTITLALDNDHITLTIKVPKEKKEPALAQARG